MARRVEPDPSVTTRELRVPIAGASDVSALYTCGERTTALYVLAHGAGAGMRHTFMEDVATRLATRGVATLRYQFPYVEELRKRPDPPRVAHATVRAAVRLARAEIGDEVSIVAGGKSFGGRMTSQAQAGEHLECVRGLVFLGFPLHAAKKPSVERAAHLADVAVPMLFLQGTRDDLASLEHLRPVVTDLGERATLHVIEGGDHSFHVLARSGRKAGDVMNEIADAIVAFVGSLR
jgi:predicted alpha/beta-hydrolase family hydrolase